MTIIFKNDPGFCGIETYDKRGWIWGVSYIKNETLNTNDIHRSITYQKSRITKYL